MSDHTSLDGEVAIVTGGARGIGEAVVEVFVAQVPRWCSAISIRTSAARSSRVGDEIGVELAFLGRTAEAVELTQRAARLDPNNDYRSQKSRALFFAGRFTEAAAEIEEITEPTRDDMAFAMLAHAELGRTQDMQRWLDRLGPQRTDFMFENWASTFGDFAPSASTQRRHWLDGLRKAGIPASAPRRKSSWS